MTDYYPSSFVVTPAALDVPVVNIVPNPSFEVDLAGWTAIAGTVGRVNTADGPVGSWSVQQTSAGLSTILQSDDIEVIGSQSQFTLSLYMHVNNNASGDIVTAIVHWYTSSHVNAGGGTLLFTTGTTPLRYSATDTAPSNAAYARVELTGSNVGGHFGVWDDVMLTAGGDLCDYFDGSVADDALYTYDWAGTPHASPSIRTPIA